MEEQCPSNDRMLEVRGITDIPTDILTLYFESKRRSRGGAVSSVKRDGDHAVIVFENPADAQQVVSKPGHMFQDVRLIVKKVPPTDPRLVVLRDLRPEISDDILTLFVEYITELDAERFTVHSSLDRTQALVHFQEALSAAAVEEMKRKASSRCLQGVTIRVEQLPQADRILVENLGPADDEEIMRLYFESRRSNGGNVLDVTMLPGGKAIVEFQEWEAANRVLQKRQMLQRRELVICPYYHFLHLPAADQERNGSRPEASAEAPVTQQLSTINVPDTLKLRVLRSSRFLQELRNEYPDLSVEIDNDNIIHVRGSYLQRNQKAKSSILDFLSNVAQVDVPVNEDLSKFLSRTDIQDYFQNLLSEREPLSCYSISNCMMTVTGPSVPAAHEVAGLIEQQVSQFSVSVSDQQLHVLTSPEWEKLLSSLRSCSTRLTDAGDQVWFISLACSRAENESRVENLLREAVLQESVIAMEPGKLRYLQDYNQDLLAGHGHVSIFPLEGDVTGLRVTGAAKSCQTMDELLRSIISTICSRAVTLQEPGISRFLLEKTGADILKQLERKYKCTIGLERACWIMPQSEHPLETQRNRGTPSLERTASDFTQLSALQHQSVEAAKPSENVPDLDEIRSLLASIKVTGQERSSEDATTLISQRISDGSESASDDEDIYTDHLPIASPVLGSEAEEARVDDGSRTLQDGDDNNNGACGPGSEVTDGDDDPQLYLALQYSMDCKLMQKKEEEDFQKALELSKMTISRDESNQKLETSEPGLEEAIKMSMAEATRTSNSAHLTIYGSADVDFNQLLDELERKIRSLVCERSVQHACFQNLSKDYKSYLEYLQRKHAVTIVEHGSEVTVRGFADYVVPAEENVTALVQWVVQDEEARAEEVTTATSVQWVRHNRQGVAVPYTLKANVFIERAFQQKQKKIDVIFDNKPYVIDFEQMKEYNVGAAESLSIERKSLNSPTDVDMLPLAFGNVELAQVNKTTEEYTKMISHFYKTLKDLHDKVEIIKVEKVNNPLLYQQYMLKKTSMVAIQSDVERILYHGTSEESAKEIYVHGFNRSFCGKNAAVYGQGVYFAASAIVSVDDQYSPPNPDGHKFVFVVKVLTGSYTKGDVKMKTPPLKESSKMALRYDSLVDNCDNPKIFVVFHDTQAYPQYLITCRWK